jgi:hypothetical protein
LKTAPLQKQSPLLETAVRELRQQDFRYAKQRRLVLISDMVQHSDLFSQYKRGRPKADDLADMNADMQGDEIRIHYIRRPSLHRIQTAAHRRFWTSYFTNAGAHVVLDDSRDLLKGEAADKQILMDKDDS